MNTINSIPKSVCSALGLALLLTIPANAAASDDNQDIVVQPSAVMQAWKAEVTQDLNKALARSSVAPRAGPNTSVVQVTFAIDADGRPTDIQLYNREGNFAARKTAIHAVSQLRNLDTVPVQGDLDDVHFVANIIFADTEDQVRKMTRRLEASESQRFASKGKERTYIALGY